MSEPESQGTDVQQLFRTVFGKDAIDSKVLRTKCVDQSCSSCEPHHSIVLLTKELLRSNIIAPLAATKSSSALGCLRQLCLAFVFVVRLR